MMTKFYTGKTKTWESYLFLLIVGMNLIPVLTHKYFPSLDGAPHLYNSQIINSLLLDDSAVLSQFYKLNPEPVPNWTGHVLLTFFNFFLPAFIAEKAVLLFYLIGLPLSFRSLVKSISPNSFVLTYLIFPFTYSYLFYLGFYNFCLALVFTFLSLRYWLTIKTFQWKQISLLALLFFVTYFSHIFVFALLLFFLGTQLLFSAIMTHWNESNNKKNIVHEVFLKLKILGISAAVPLALLGYYFLSRPASSENTFVPAEELINWLQDIRPIIALNVEIESVYTKPLYYLLSILFLIAIAIRIYHTYKVASDWKNALKELIQPTDVWLLIALSLLVLYFKLPDTSASAGYISIRLGLFFFLFIILWLAVQSYYKGFAWIAVILTLYCNFKMNNYYDESSTELNKIIQDCEKASKFIAANSIVLPLNYTNNWLTGHFSNYLGIDKRLVILENYECGTTYFPVQWNDKALPNLTLGTKPVSDIPCINWQKTHNSQVKKIDYVFILGDIKSQSDSCTNEVNTILKKQYTIIYGSSYCQLFRKK